MIVDTQSRINETFEFIAKRIKQVAKTKGVRICGVDFDPTTKAVIIETDCPEWVGDEVAYNILPKSKYGICVEVIQHPGSFDWASDTYIKDAVEVRFKI